VLRILEPQVAYAASIAREILELVEAVEEIEWQ
jgi:hypothetical protein